tara:strand:- start:1432 stop:1677 length:246 start_codon:yes stop_codon:yes gene_type:complete
MNESLVNILARLELEVEELKSKVLTLENKKALPFGEDIEELKSKVLTLENKKALPFGEDVKSNIKLIVTADFITALYKRGE